MIYFQFAEQPNGPITQTMNPSQGPLLPSSGEVLSIKQPNWLLARRLLSHWLRGESGRAVRAGRLFREATAERWITIYLYARTQRLFRASFDACMRKNYKFNNIRFHIPHIASILTERRNLFVSGAAWSDSNFSRAPQQVAAQWTPRDAHPIITTEDCWSRGPTCSPPWPCCCCWWRPEAAPGSRTPGPKSTYNLVSTETLQHSFVNWDYKL